MLAPHLYDVPIKLSHSCLTFMLSTPYTVSGAWKSHWTWRNMKSSLMRWGQGKANGILKKP